jgi:hypothetical protein
MCPRNLKTDHPLQVGVQFLQFRQYLSVQIHAITALSVTRRQLVPSLKAITGPPVSSLT